MLKVTQLSGIRANRKIFSKITFSLKPSTLLQVTGPNGSGKSTLLKMLAGLLPIEKGVVQSCFLNKNIKQTISNLLTEDPEYVAEILYIGHKTGLTLSLSPRENLLLWQSLKFNPDQADIKKLDSKVKTIDEILELLKLTPYKNKLCEVLSAGQRQKVVLGRLWCESAQLWLLDEPFTAIDKETQTLIEEQMSIHIQSGGAILLVNHAATNLPSKLGHAFQTLALE